MNKKFSSEFIEKEFLLLCSPSELLEYFDNISKQITQRENPFSVTKISENIENALYDYWQGGRLEQNQIPTRPDGY